VRLAGLPLLGKELVEQAARRRTYVIRVLYAVALFLVFALFFRDLAEGITQPEELLGKGRQVFDLLVYFQFAGIYAFLPAMMSGAITYEKERRSLELLLLTDLRPWEIVIEKLVGRLVPMLTFLLLSLPLMGVAYSMGGVSSDQLCSGAWLTLVTCLQVGTLALAVSAWCRTTVAAFLLSYVILGVVYFAWPLLCISLFAFNIARPSDIPEEVAFFMVPPFLFADMSGSSGQVVAEALLRSVPVALTALVSLGAARALIVRRAFVPPGSSALRFHSFVDLTMASWNRIVGNIVLVKDSGGLPGDEPVAWREVTKKALGKTRYLFRLFVILEVPVVFIIVTLFSLEGARSSSLALTAMLACVWGLAVLAVSIPSAAAVVGERARQTIEVLLTTPMEGSAIVGQKMRGIRRLGLVLAVPLVTVIVAEAWIESQVYWLGGSVGPWGYLALSSLCVGIYLPMFAWVSMWIGIRARSGARAILTVLGLLVAWNGAPYLVVGAAGAVTGARPDASGLSYLLLLSPATMVGLLEISRQEDVFDLFRGPATIPVTLNFLWHGGLAYYFRHLSLRQADRYLGRVGAEDRTGASRLRRRHRPDGEEGRAPGERRRPSPGAAADTADA
jgi:ABC-type Na+ efflux pump permease subunit